MAATRKKEVKKNGKRWSFSFFSDMDVEKKSGLLKYSGIAVLVFAIFTFVSVLSYLFTWQADQSLMCHPEMMDSGVEVSNWAGKMGYRWAELLVCRCFGLGSFALIFLFGACVELSTRFSSIPSGEYFSPSAAMRRDLKRPTT